MVKTGPFPLFCLMNLKYIKSINIAIMKNAFSCILLLLAISVFGQDYSSLVSKAEQFYGDKDYKKSIAAYQKAFKTGNPETLDYYNAARAATIADQKSLAFQWLNMAFLQGWTNVEYLKNDLDLNALHSSQQWTDLVLSMQKANDEQLDETFDEALQVRLLKIHEADQVIRRKLDMIVNTYGLKSPPFDSLMKLIKHHDSINLIEIAPILDEFGWPGPEKVGPIANNTLSLVIQHANLATQQKYLPLMRMAVKAQKATASALALVEDQVALGEGRNQIYGSQVQQDDHTREYFILPIEDPENVDKRRARIGLGPMSEYAKRYGLKWDLKEHKKHLPELEKKIRAN
jgi:hypothetical protein